MRAQLERRLGAPQAPQYLLEVRQTAPRRPAAIRSSGVTVRYNLIGTATWRLRDVASGRVIDTGEVEGFTSYSGTGSTVATQSAETDAAARLSVTLADMIVTRMLVLLQDAPS
ncbi:lipopolysaccharide assembly protein [Yoonia sediminilitoris]|uniref:Lipopolysaccharide assembly protein n=2 Tax=Yoonia sediminilitoris TaxID=1286148 RepID=A0A2T6K9W7_9RHOB|nr:lipopolysaccharide assembly protein [Yoonia sediminilitoris]RCW91802.1 lipopolysaccharide assembly protein [Yoonia sediminilitoris]